MNQLPGSTERRELAPDERASLVRAMEGDKEATAELRRLLRHSPELAEAMAGDAAEAALDLLLHNVWDKFPLVQDAMRLKMRAVGRDLAGVTSTPLEALLIQRIVACWLHLAHADTLYASLATTANQRTIEHLEERRDRAHRRYLSAIKALAQVRRLLVPLVQVNMAQNQVVANVAK